MALSDYLDRASRERWVWGRHDCCQFVRRWVEEVTGRDPAAAWRYSTEQGAALLASRSGGLVALFGRLAETAGLAPTSEPQAGDVGVINILTGEGARHVGAICTGPGWAVASDRGLLRVRAAPLAAWRLHG